MNTETPPQKPARKKAAVKAAPKAEPGKSQISVVFDTCDLEAIDAAAKAKRLTRTSFIRLAALAAI